jgi:hypothetical protein
MIVIGIWYKSVPIAAAYCGHDSQKRFASRRTSSSSEELVLGGRAWTGLHRQGLMSCIAFAYSVICGCARRPGGKTPDPRSFPRSRCFLKLAAP